MKLQLSKIGRAAKSMRPILIVNLLLFTMLLPNLVFADFTGPVVSVLDGDTIEVLHNTTHERVRLSGIDCPEKGQAFGSRAKQAFVSVRLRERCHPRHTRASTGTPLQVSSCGTEQTSTRCWSKTAGVGGTGSVRLEMLSLRSWRMT